MKNFTLVIGRDHESGMLTAVVPELPGCMTSGDSLSELELNAKQAIQVYLDSNFRLAPTTQFLGVQSIHLDS